MGGAMAQNEGFVLLLLNETLFAKRSNYPRKTSGLACNELVASASA
jgi:hypothetical protein